MSERCEVTDKVIHEDKGYARRAIESIRRTRQGIRKANAGRKSVLVPYRCNHCGGWHVGKTMAPEREAAR